MANKKQDLLSAMYDVTDETSSETIREMYDAWAGTYDQELIDQQGYVMPERAAAVLARHFADRDARLLDVGCGTGLSGLALARAGFRRIDGCDLSEEMLARARQCGIYGRLFQTDLTAPPLDAAEESYDAAVAVGAFSFGHIPTSAMDDILRIVKPGGLFVLTVNDPYFGEGTVTAKLDQLEADGVARVLEREHGEHIRGKEIGGWVFVLAKG